MSAAEIPGASELKFNRNLILSSKFFAESLAAYREKFHFCANASADLTIIIEGGGYG